MTTGTATATETETEIETATEKETATGTGTGTVTEIPEGATQEMIEETIDVMTGGMRGGMRGAKTIVDVHAPVTDGNTSPRLPEIHPKSQSRHPRLRTRS